MKKIVSLLLFLALIFTLAGCVFAQPESGKTPYIQDGYWYIDGTNTGVKAEGVDGTNGKDGQNGTNGKDGINGADGKDGIDGADGKTPYIQDGYWYIDGVNTGVLVNGNDESSKDDIIYTKNPDSWVRQHISADGMISQPGVTTYDRSQIMYSTTFDGPVELIPNGNIFFGFVIYDENGGFKERIAWYTKADGPQIFNDVNPFNVVIAAGELDSSISVEDMLERFTLRKISQNEINEQEKTDSIQSQLDYLNFIQSCDISEKIVHFSCDDTYACLYDLIQNQNIYTSIFENSFFASLKTCHDATGACFTLNTFNTITTVPDYDISNVPSKFQEEFQANKSWLRFAFHAENETTNYASATDALESYNKFVDAIYKLTGDYDCIDRIARLHFFSGSLENILSMKDADYGIIGLLTADDERISYYLSNEQSEIARLKGKYLDLENKLLFIKTLNRKSETAKQELDSNPLYRKTTEIFWHEQENLEYTMTWITSMAQYCNNLGYIHGFLCDIYKPIE